MKSNQRYDDDNMRITISIGLTGSFLVTIFSLNAFLPYNISPIYQIIRTIVYVYFVTICALFVGFLLTKASELKYRNKNNVGVIDIYIPRGVSEFLFDSAVSFSLYSPIGAITAVYFTYAPKWLMNILSLGSIEGYLVTFILYFVGFISFYIPIDYFINYKKRGYQ
jgi:hypothetical protein